MYTYRNTATMKYIDFKILFCSFLFFVSSSTVAQTIDSDSVVYYLYDHVKENQGSGNAWEDRIIELVYRGDSVSGCMWGTSDEFQGAREGYYPGHYVIGLKDVRICGHRPLLLINNGLQMICNSSCVLHLRQEHVSRISGRSINIFRGFIYIG